MLRRLNLGCGPHPQEGWINLDITPGKGVDIVRDVLRGLPFCNDSLSAIASENFLEHIPQGETIWLMNEMHRALKPGGIATHMFPIAGSPADYQDPTHLSRWNRDVMTYFDQAHKHNAYYGGAIKPWILLRCDPGANHTMTCELQKP